MYHRLLHPQLQKTHFFRSRMKDIRRNKQMEQGRVAGVQELHEMSYVSTQALKDSRIQATPGFFSMPSILFVCTGNFYRSRFAEAVFNHYAKQRQSPWRAFSRGLAVHLAEGS